MENIDLKLYESMYLIRRSEEKIKEHYLEDEMKTPMHMSMGSEAIIAGVCECLDRTDQVFGTYRSHALYLAKVAETDAFFGEMYGKVTGVAKGKGGSMHLLAPEAGLMCTSAIVASNIPVAIGAAFANKQSKNGKLVAVFFGDGAVEEGVFWESVNAACLMQLPVIFICEDNEIAVHTDFSHRRGFDELGQVIKGFNCYYYNSDSTDVSKIHQLTQHAIEKQKAELKPTFLHLKYHRYLEHVGVFEDYEAGYRDRKEYQTWLAKDPIALQRKKLCNLLGEVQVNTVENSVNLQIVKSIEQAKQANFPEPSVAYEDIYS